MLQKELGHKQHSHLLLWQVYNLRLRNELIFLLCMTLLNAQFKKVSCNLNLESAEYVHPDKSIIPK